MTVTASAISGILARAGFKKAAKGRHWSSGFEVQQNVNSVSICYNSADCENEAVERIQKIADTINSRPGKKYFAKPDPEKPNYLCLVTAYDETDPEQNEARKAQAQGELVADHPAVPVIADIKEALRRYSQYDADLYGPHGTYKVERVEDDASLVRVRHIEGPSVTYPEGSRDEHIEQTLANYARVLHEDGFEIQVHYEEMSVLVAMPGKWDNVLTGNTVAALLRSNFSPSKGGFGGYVVWSYNKDEGAVRVEYLSKADETERQIHDTVERYGKFLVKQGYNCMVDYHNDWDLLVTLPTPQKESGEEQLQETREDIQQALYELRVALEEHLMVSTRKAGPWSIFAISEKTNARRVEIFYRNGEYRIRLGRVHHFATVGKMLQRFVWTELELN